MGDIDNGDAFKGLPMEDLIGGPLRAAADAQALMAKTAAEFITQVGLTGDYGSTPPPSLWLDADEYEDIDLAIRL
ncbi:MAG: DUF2589 domain-containing protein [Rikenellaceae bacterium]|jgi:hypothetical protein|nr:DUF2589 domain-containing protein [Rikenellaceae bacterium]